MMASRWKLFLEWGSILSLIACSYWIFMLTPIETSQGFSQKIMYLHVPTVIVTYPVSYTHLTLPTICSV